MRVPRGSKIKKSFNLEVLVSHTVEPRFYQTQIDPNHSPGLLNLLFKHIFHNICPTHADFPNMFYCEFLMLFLVA